MNINLKPYRLLIIDDFAQFRLALKKMLERKGAEKIDQVGNATDALKACKNNRYDIIFCDYNLGEGQDGQQLLEELHERELLAKGCLFIMVTAEMMSARVLGALEYRPDAYLGKPFPFEQLSIRVDRLIARNQALAAVHRALQAGEIDKALIECDRVLDQLPTARFACLRIKAEILEQQQAVDAEREIYDRVIREQPLIWAQVGIGKLLFNAGQVDEALAHFQQLREAYPRQVGVIDWIARCQLALGETEKSERALQQALELSPKSVARQSRLGAVAEQLEHHDIAQQAWAYIVNEGQHSCLVSGESYQRYFTATGKTLATLDSRELDRAIGEIETNAKKMEARFRHDANVLATNQCALADLFREAGRDEMSGRYADKLAATLDDPQCLLSSEQHAFIETRLNTLQTDRLDDELEARIRARLDAIGQAIEKRNNQDDVARAINQAGLSLLEQKRPEPALDKFREAVALMPDNPTYLLNAAQMVLLDETLRGDPARLREARQWMHRITLKRDDSRMPLYLMLKGRLPDG